jgi:tetratricopeptide (TPR) repeat protein
MKKGLTQVDLASGLCTPSMISQIESDRARPSYKMLMSLAERLDVAMEILLTEVDMNLETVSQYKMARAMLAAKEYELAIPLYRKMLDTPRAHISTLELLFDLGECYLNLNHLDDAEQTFKEVHQYAILRDEKVFVAEVFTRFGTIAMKRKQLQLAIYQYRKAVEALEKSEVQDPILKADILYKLGGAFMQTGLVDEAVSTYDLVAALYEGQNRMVDLAHVYMRLGQSYKMANDLEKSVEFSDRAASLFKSVEHLSLALKLKVETASMCIRTGREAEAELLLQDAIKGLDMLGDKEHEGIAWVEMAHLHFQKREFGKAAETCELAGLLLPEQHLYQAKINRLHGRLAEVRGDHSEAERRLQMAADVFKHSGEISEWDDTMFALAALYQQQNEMGRTVQVLEEIRSFTKHVLTQRGIAL